MGGHHLRSTSTIHARPIRLSCKARFSCRPDSHLSYAPRRTFVISGDHLAVRRVAAPLTSLEARDSPKTSPCPGFLLPSRRNLGRRRSPIKARTSGPPLTRADLDRGLAHAPMTFPATDRLRKPDRSRCKSANDGLHIWRFEEDHASTNKQISNCAHHRMCNATPAHFAKQKNPHLAN